MDRYDDLDLDLECDGGGGGVAQKAALFGGMFKKSTKSSESSVKAEDSLSANSELSKSNDSLTDNNKDKGGVFKGIFKKTKSAREGQQQDSISLQNPELSVSSDSLTDKASKDKSGVLGGILKRSPRPGHVRRPSQDLLDISDSNENPSENSNTKESGGIFTGMFKKPSKPFGARTKSQEDLTAPDELSGSSDNLSANNNTKETGGMFSGMFKKPPKAFGGRTKSQEDLTAPDDLSGSRDNLCGNSNTKETGGVFSLMFKKPLKPFGARTKSQEDLCAPDELSDSSDNLSVNSNTKEEGGMFSGLFKKAPKPFGTRTKSQDDLSAPDELSGSTEDLSENHTKEKGGIFSGVLKKKGAKFQSQDDLSMDGELFTGNDSLAEKPSRGGVAARILKNPFSSSSQEKEKTEHSGDSNENSSTADKPKAKQIGFSAVMKSAFYTDKEEKSSSTDDEETDNGDNQLSHKQSKLAEAMTKLNPFRAANKHEKQTGSDDEDPTVSSEKSKGNKQNTMVEAMSKLNPYRAAHEKDTEDTETLKETEKQVEAKLKPVKSNMIQQERKERSETPLVPPRPTAECVVLQEMKGTVTYNKVKPRRAKDNKDNKDMTTKEKKEKPLEAPVIPARPSEEEMNRAPRQKQKKNHQMEDEAKEEDESAMTKDGDETNPPESKTTKVVKHKRHNPFMLHTAAKASNQAASDDEWLKEDEESSSREKKEEEEGKEKTVETKIKKPKKHNPFMPRVKAKVIQKHGQDEAAANTAENEGANRSLFDQLEDFRIDPAHPEDSQDVEDLMDWWNTVDPWEDTPQDDDMTEKEEAKAFAVTAEKVQKGIRVFNKLFSERAESLWQHVIDLNSIADGLDKFNKKTKIAQITGGSTSAIGGVATIAGLALAPVTMGTSLIVTAVGLGVATAGGLTSAGAGISNQVNNSMDRKKVEKIVEDYQEKMLDLNKCLKFIKQGIENLRKFDLIKMKKHAYNRDFPVLNSNFYEDGAMAGKAILINANEIMRVVQIANVAGSTAARAVQIASMATGVLTGLFVGMDIYFVAKDSKELKKGAKSEFAGKIRDVATQLHDGLVELNSIREELQATTPENNAGSDGEALDSEKKEKEEKHEGSDEEEDEIARIKKAIKKDYENREYV
ncbi:apolipoprotein L1 isoform X4 [Amphiprion ocellaris]|uniref:apolipoprotein L1 isoform X4 n=1 Tax=Amphiprion ocellaris TaxID=80972 RepID=UPI002411055B|nr:apolipoprotein L1 isoform X4 [Amphiprion ocellaris]